MPRMKKKPPTDKSVLPAMRIYKTALYVRLSLEDMRKKSAETVLTQKALLEGFIQNCPDLEVYDVYEDINFTGTNFSRPGFMRMLEDIKAGLVDCVVVKDLSRFGRNYMETGKYLEQEFPNRQVRFISINDNYDSLTASVDESGLIVPLKNLINEMYARDCSKKTSTGFKVKQQRGEFCGAFAAYGYIKEGNTLIIDDDAAPIVKMIFEWRLAGEGIHAICLKLNEMKILPPSRHRFVKGITKAKKHEEAVFWYNSAVKRILQNPSYTGTMTQARYKSNFLRRGGVIETNKEDWIVVENTHPAIINKEIYEAVQKTFVSSHGNRSQEVQANRKAAAINRRKADENVAESGNIFKGLIFCGDCGKHMCRSSRRTKFTYVCFVYEKVDKKACTMKPIKEAALRKAVFSVLRNEIDLAVDMREIISKEQKQTTYLQDLSTYESKTAVLQKKLNDISRLKNTLLDDRNEGLISDEDYALFLENFDKKSEKLQQELNDLNIGKLRGKGLFSQQNKWVTEFSQFKGEEQLSAKMLNLLVRRIDVFDGSKLEITLHYRDELEALQQYITAIKARDANE